MAQAVVVEAYGGPEVLQAKEVQVGKPGPSQVRLRHTRIGVNFHDVYVRSGLYKTLTLPGIPGIEAAGVVEECGRDAKRWKPGDRVAYVTGAYGVYASERLIDEAELLAVPEGV
jgi:NADPH:quinone reductase